MTETPETAYTNGEPNWGGYNRYSGPQIEESEATWLKEWDWGGRWEYDMLVIYKSATSSEIRAAVDSGCSCPTPFSDLTWDTMRRVDSVDDVMSLLGATDKWGDTHVGTCPDETVADIKAFVHRYLRDAS